MGTGKEVGEWLGPRSSAAPGAPEPNLNLLGAGSQLRKGGAGGPASQEGQGGCHWGRPCWPS